MKKKLENVDFEVLGGDAVAKRRAKHSRAVADPLLSNYLTSILRAVNNEVTFISLGRTDVFLVDAISSVDLMDVVSGGWSGGVVLSLRCVQQLLVLL